MRTRPSGSGATPSAGTVLPEPRNVVVQASEDGERLDRLVARHIRVSRRVARTLIARGLVQVNNRTVRILTRPIRAGARIRVLGDAPADGQAVAVTDVSAQELQILHLDRSVIAVNKPAGLLSESDDLGAPSVESVVPKLLLDRGEKSRIWVVHRLDAGTSGVMILARRAAVARRLCDAFRHGDVEKTYLALCTGRLPDERLVDVPIGRVKGVRHGVRADGKPASTRLVPLVHGSDVTLVQALPRTGRTHQIRVHLSHSGHPILGDRLYGGRGYTAESPPQAIPRPMLHAERLAVRHPESGERLLLSAAVADDFSSLADRLGIGKKGAPWKEA